MTDAADDMSIRDAARRLRLRAQDLTHQTFNAHGRTLLAQFPKAAPPRQFATPLAFGNGDDKWATPHTSEL